MAPESEKYSLIWEDFQQNANRSFAELREDRDFCDVTLVCHENKQVPAHRVVLGSSSSLLSSVLRSNSHPNPLLFLWGVQASQLEAVLDFCYRGQVTLPKMDLEEFLRVAKLLGVKGTGGVDSGVEEEDLNQKINISKPIANPEEKSIKTEFQIEDTFVEMENPLLSFSTGEINNIEQEETSHRKNLIFQYFTINTDNKTIASCTICGKKIERRQIKVKKGLRYSNRFLNHHLRKHHYDFEQFTATRNSLALEERFKMKNEEKGEKVDTITIINEPISKEQAAGEILHPKVPTSEVNLSPVISKQATEKYTIGIMVEQKMEYITTPGERQDHGIIEPLLKCDYLNCGFVSSRAFNLSKHKVLCHEKRSVPLLCSRSFCIETFDSRKELQEHRDICVIKCSWKQCGKEFTRGDHFKKHTHFHPQDGKGKEDEFAFSQPKVTSAPLNIQDMEIKLKNIWSQMKPN